MISEVHRPIVNLQRNARYVRVSIKFGWVWGHPCQARTLHSLWHWHLVVFYARSIPDWCAFGLERNNVSDRKRPSITSVVVDVEASFIITNSSVFISKIYARAWSGGRRRVMSGFTTMTWYPQSNGSIRTKILNPSGENCSFQWARLPNLSYYQKYLYKGAKSLKYL